MLTLSVQNRKIKGKKLRGLRQKGFLPAVLYGAKTENQPLILDLKEFEKVYKQAGEFSLLRLNLGKKQFDVLIHDVQQDPLTKKAIHVDFYQPELEEEVEVTIPLIFEGQAPAAKELGGVLVKSMTEVEIRALTRNLPRAIKVNVGSLKTFKDDILIEDLPVPERVEILHDAKETVATVIPPEKVEEVKKTEEEVVAKKAEKEVQKGKAGEEEAKRH